VLIQAHQFTSLHFTASCLFACFLLATSKQTSLLFVLIIKSKSRSSFIYRSIAASLLFSPSCMHPPTVPIMRPGLTICLLFLKNIRKVQPTTPASTPAFNELPPLIYQRKTRTPPYPQLGHIRGPAKEGVISESEIKTRKSSFVVASLCSFCGVQVVSVPVQESIN
jgi:hypothetical protein